MFKRTLIVLLIVIISITACNKKENLYRVVKVKDGDTLELLSPDNVPVTVRLAEIDCPEKSQAFGQKAKQFTADLCFGKMVSLVVNNRDRYGRTVGQVLLEDGTNVNYEIVKNGYAWQYQAYSKNPELSLLQEHARQSRLGLWQDSNPTPPWDFRKGEKQFRQGKTGAAKKSKRTKRTYRKRKQRQADTVVF
ncbi:nuclease [Mucilaginibacter pallidiroseus]|uniref:Nuclease n=1 Tax=Mucilaginibacter pallidiroseus TaxID=2599295 RepID=A0A563U3C2_9SPHI|nr:thermonuclease family protein [Mucilaginibacter pallidiroseus]TWR25846.1 nuclease [Mucilaginibacter pallidiroseus]